MATEMQDHLGMISQQFQGEMQAISAQLLTLVSTRKSLQKQGTISPEIDTDSPEESSEEDGLGTATEAGASEAPGRKYSMTFEEVSAQTGLSILQLKRRAKSGEIEVTSSGKIRVKSVQNLHQHRPRKPHTGQSEPARKPALSLVKKGVVNE